MSLYFSQRGDAKENCGINGTNVKEVKRVKKLAEVNKNTSTKKVLSLHSLAKAPAQLSSNSRNTHQAGFQVLKTQNNSTASLQNPRKPHKAEETAGSIHAANWTRQQSLQSGQHKAHQAQPASNTTQKSRKPSLVSACGPSKSGYGISAHRRTDQTSCAKTELQSTRPLAKKLAETNIKSTSTVNLKSQRPMSTTGTKIQINNVSKTQAKLTQQPRSQSAVPKFGIHNSSSQSSKSMSTKSNSAANRFDVNQRKDISCIITKVDATKTKSHCSVTNRVTRTSVSTLSKPANGEGSAIIKNKLNITVKPTSATAKPPSATASTKLLGRNTKSCVLPQTSTAPQELQRPAERSNQAKPAVQFQTPKSSFCPSTQGVRTAPVDGRKKPTAAQEQRL